MSSIENLVVKKQLLIDSVGDLGDEDGEAPKRRGQSVSLSIK